MLMGSSYMEEVLMREYYSFLYLDKKSIKNLYPQIFGDMVEKTVICSREWEVESMTKAGIFNTLGSSIRGDKNASSSESIKSEKNTAVKAQELINWIRSQENVKDIKCIQDIIESNKNKNSFPFVGKEVFMLRGVYEIGETVHWLDEPFNISNKSVFVLESGKTDFVNKNIAEYQGTEFYSLNRNCKYGIMMHVSKLYMQKEIYSLFTFFRKGEVTSLNVYGQVIKCSDFFYKIDPYAIWM